MSGTEPDSKAREALFVAIEHLVGLMAPWTAEEAERLLRATGVAATHAERPVASPEAAGMGIPVDDGKLFALIAAARARFETMTPAEQEAELRAQRESWVRGQTGWEERPLRSRQPNNDHEDDGA